MVISPPLVISPEEIDLLISRVNTKLDECLLELKTQDLLKRRS